MIDKLKDKDFLKFLRQNSSGEYKKCSKCGENYPIEMYSFRSDTNKFRGQCSMCHKGYHKSTWLKGMLSEYMYSIGIKECSKCGSNLPIEEFTIDKHTKTGLASNCKDCKRDSVDKDVMRLRVLKYRYGATDDNIRDFELIDKCEICGSDFNGRKCFDHDHNSGDYRGALCYNCNIGLGSFMDNTDSLGSAIKYLKRKNKA